jgi:hypothetical protein
MPYHQQVVKVYSVLPRVAIMQPTNGTTLLNSNVTLTAHVFGGVVERTVTVFAARMRNATSEFVVAEIAEEDLAVLPFPADYFRPGSYVLTASAYADEDPVANTSAASKDRLQPNRWLEVPPVAWCFLHAVSHGTFVNMVRLQRQKLASARVDFHVVSSVDVLANGIEGPGEGPAL